MLNHRTEYRSGISPNIMDYIENMKEDLPDIGRTQLTIIFLMSAVTAAISYIIYKFYIGTQISLQIGAIMTGFGALGTLYLAYTTYHTINQNEKMVQLENERIEQLHNQLEEMKKENKKPVYENLISRILIPVKRTIDKNHRSVENNLGWDQDSGTQLEYIKPNLHIHATTESKFRSEFPETYANIETYDELVKNVDNSAETFARAVKKSVKIRVEDKMNDFDHDKQSKVIELFVKRIVNRDSSGISSDWQKSPEEEIVPECVDPDDLAWLDSRTIYKVWDMPREVRLPHPELYEDQLEEFKTSLEDLQTKGEEVQEDIRRVEVEIYNEYPIVPPTSKMNDNKMER